MELAFNRRTVRPIYRNMRGMIDERQEVRTVVSPLGYCGTGVLFCDDRADSACLAEGPRLAARGHRLWRAL